MGSEKVFLFCLTLFSTLIIVSCSNLVFSGNASKIYEKTESQFQDFIVKYKKSYAIGSEEYYRRLRVFESNLDQSAKLNSLRRHPNSAVYGVTKFSDMTQAEFKEKYLSDLTQKLRPFPLQKPVTHTFPSQHPNKLKGPKRFDWRTSGFIVDPRDQQSCGACWAFASVETIESMYAMQTKQLVPLSVQQMIDCSYHYSSYLAGCNGGDTCSAFNWANQTKTAFVPESTYPYADETKPCQVNQKVNKTKGPVVTDFTCLNFAPDESKMVETIVNNGPVTVSVDASNWNNYQGGVIQFHCGEVASNHAVQVVGYDLTAPVPYYIVKNSWGKDFGIDGYLYVMYGGNVCSIAREVSNVQVQG